MSAAGPETAGDHPFPAYVVVLIVAFAAGVVAQGGYYRPGRILTAALVGAALVVAPGFHRRIAPQVRLVVLACAALGCWAVVRAVPTGDYPVPLGYLTTLGCLAVAVLLLARTGTAVRERVVETLVLVGAAMAVTAWAGVAWRLPRFAVLVEGRLWRGASTLTYSNAAAALLAVLALLALALLRDRPRSPALVGAGYLLLLGVGAALSRAGFVALATGFVVLALLCGVRATVAASAPPILGAAVAGAALVPSFPAGGAPRPLLALGGLLAGAAIAAGAARLSTRGRLVAASTLPVVAVLAVVLAVTAGTGSLAAVLASRGTLASSGRSGALASAVDLVAAHPLVGVGAGQARFFWTTPDGSAAVALYAHNEYLQLLVDLGALGSVLLLGLIVAAGAAVRRGRAGPYRPRVWAGAVAGLAALAVHSGFDFLWHIAVLPLTAGLLIGLAGPATSEEPTITTPSEEKQ